MQRTQQAQAILGTSDVVMITERVDEVALRIGQMVQMGVPEVLDRHLPRHWTPRGLSWGGTAGSWLGSIVTEGDHRHVSVETSLKGMPHPLSRLTGQGSVPLDFRDDRLSHLLQHVRQPASWPEIERDLNARSIAVDDWSQDVIRCDATTVAGDHEGTEEGRGPFGQSKDEPARPPINVMRGALAPLGRPLATEVLSGERAEDGVSLPLMERGRSGGQTPGLLFVGARKMPALAPRASLARPQDCSLSPLPLPGATAEAMEAWITAGVTQGARGEGERLMRTNDRGHPVLAAAGYECERSGAAPGDTRDAATWRERVGVRRSPLHADHQAAGLEKRLGHAETKLAALTPPRGRGTRHITAEATLVAASALGLPEHRGHGLRRGTWPQQVEQSTPYVGRGRGSGQREKRGIEPTRCHLTPLARQATPRAALRQRFGWKALGTTAPPPQRSGPEAGWCYRHAYRLERLCNRLKSRVHIAPLCVKLNDHIEARTYLLTLGVRVVTVREFGLRRSLQTEQTNLPGVPPANKQKMTDKPTAERLLQAFADVSLTIIKQAVGENILRRRTSLSG